MLKDGYQVKVTPEELHRLMDKWAEQIEKPMSDVLLDLVFHGYGLAKIHEDGSIEHMKFEYTLE